MKPGLRTTEFWIQSIAEIATLILIFGPEQSWWVKVAAVVAATAGRIGYHFARARAKAGSTVGRPPR